MLSVSALLFEHGRRSPVLLPNISSVCVSATAGECEKSNRGYNNNLQSGGKLYIEMKKHTSLNLDGRPDLICCFSRRSQMDSAPIATFSAVLVWARPRNRIRGADHHQQFRPHFTPGKLKANPAELC